MLPGARQLTRIAYGANSIAAHLLKNSTAAFEARYVVTPPPAWIPPIDDTLTIDPPPSVDMCFPASRVPSMTPSRLTDITR